MTNIAKQMKLLDEEDKEIERQIEQLEKRSKEILAQQIALQQDCKHVWDEGGFMFSTCKICGISDW